MTITKSQHPLQWLERLEARIETLETATPIDRFLGRYTGYERLPVPGERYEGNFAIVRLSGVTGDRMVTCLRNLDGSYQWATVASAT